MNYEARYNQEQASWIKQGWEEGKVNEYQLWDLCNARLDLQHHARLFLELGFIPCSGFPLVPVHIKEWLLVHHGALYGRWAGWLVIIRPLLVKNVVVEIFNPAGDSVYRDSCEFVEIAQWRAESYLRDMAVTQ